MKNAENVKRVESLLSLVKNSDRSRDKIETEIKRQREETQRDKTGDGLVPWGRWLAGWRWLAGCWMSDGRLGDPVWVLDCDRDREKAAGLMLQVFSQRRRRSRKRARAAAAALPQDGHRMATGWLTLQRTKADNEVKKQTITIFSDTESDVALQEQTM